MVDNIPPSGKNIKCAHWKVSGLRFWGNGGTEDESLAEVLRCGGKRAGLRLVYKLLVS